MNESTKRNPAIIALIVIVLLAAAGGAVYLATRPSDDASQQTVQDASSQETDIPTSSQTGDTSESTATYKDGTYTATGSYSTPGGRESIDLSVTIENDVITDTSATGSANSGDSAQYQGEFLDNYRAQVVGRNVDEVNLSRVAGSSLTSNGFNNALDEIAQDARS